ncbi:MAG: ubiquitin-like domain-containing protein [Chloroflexota bacterium]
MPKHPQAVVLLLLIPALALLVAGGVLLYRGMQRQVLIDIDQEPIIVRGRFDSVGEALAAADIQVQDEDYVWPPPASPSTEQVLVRSATPVELSIDGNKETRWTLQDSLASFLAEQDLTLNRTSTVFVDGRPVPPSALVATDLGSAVEINSQMDITVDDGGGKTLHLTEATTVGRYLIEAGFDIYGADHVTPRLESWLSSDSNVVIERATPVTVNFSDSALTARTSSHDVASVLADLGVGLVGRDTASPGLGYGLTEGGQIRISRAKTGYELTESPVPYSSQLLALDTLEIDQRTLVSAGAPGSQSRLARIDVSVSDWISPTIVGEWISQPPTNEVVGYGTNIVVRTIETTQGPLSYWRVVRMRVTAYTAASAGKSIDHPGYGITASGRPAGYGVVAIDPDVVPFRSQVYVPGYGVGYAGDTGGGVKGRIIDLGYDEGQIEPWNGYVDVYYLTPVPEQDRINYLIPTTLP